MITKAFVLLSGGIDSTTALHIAHEECEEVEALSIHYGQRHNKERDYAKRTCDRLGIPQTRIDIPAYVLGGKSVMLTDESVEIPNISYDEIEGVSPTYVPFRNGTMLSVVAAHAQKWVNGQIDAYCAHMRVYDIPGEPPTDWKDFALRLQRDSAHIYFGAHAEDAHNWAYPDCTPEFIGAISSAIYTGTYYTVRVHTPLMWMKKHEIIQKGEQLGVKWEDTWSCYAGGALHCGICPTCRARNGAFLQANVYDPTEYQMPAEAPVDGLSF